MAKANFVLSKKNLNNNDTDAMVANQNALNYKGVFYGDDTEQKYFEGGAHFEYHDLCKRLNNIIMLQTAEEKEMENTQKKLQSKENGLLNNNSNNLLKESQVSRNKNIISNSNTLKTINPTKINLYPQMSSTVKSNLIKDQVSSNKVVNGADPTFHQGMNNYKTENPFVKLTDNYSKLAVIKKKEDDKSLVKSSMNVKSSNDQLELKSNLNNINAINNGINYFLMRSDVRKNLKYIYIKFQSKWNESVR